jgi:hypothetical protein
VADWNLQERRLSELSDIQVRYLLGSVSRKPYLEILVVKYVGVYPLGSAGNDDAQYMYAMAKAGVAAFEPWGVIHDLSELNYEWGDMLDNVFTIGPREPRQDEKVMEGIFGGNLGSVAMRPAVVVGPGCEEAVRTLLLGLDSPEPIEKVGYVFRDFKSAWSYVDDQIR